MNIKTSALRLGGRVLRIIPPNTVLHVFSGINKGAKWIRGSANCPEWLGTYEPEHQRVIRSIVQPGMVVYDIGANAGFFTLAFSRLVGSKGRVVAFEPVPANVAKLLTHIHLNRTVNTSIVPIAIGAQSGLQAFSFGESDFQGRLEAHGQADFIVPVMSVDQLVNSGQFPAPGLIKMDIEGGEFDALCGSRDTLQSTGPRLIVSLHGEEQKGKCCQFLKDIGYCFEFFGQTQGPNTDICAYKRDK